MKKISLISILFLFVFSSYSQSNTEIKRNTIYAEAFGSSVIYSISYDRLFRVDKKIKSSLTIGISPIWTWSYFVLATPISYNFLYGKNNHNIEIGLGFTPQYYRNTNGSVGFGYVDNNGIVQYEVFTAQQNELYTYIIPKIGYRFQKPDGGFFFRLTFLPLIAGINIHGRYLGSSHPMWNNSVTYEYFTSVEGSGVPFVPWGGISFGYTLKR